MNADVKRILTDLATRLWALPIEDYLASAEFTRFCREHDLGDAWQEYRELSRDRPDLYGSSVTQHAFILFLDHIFHKRPAEFLSLFTGLLADFSRRISCNLPVDDIRSSLLLLGYSERTADPALFTLRLKQEPEPSEICCPQEKRDPGPRKKEQ
jgi:hypothetical protein